jgi:two-component system, sporulation sensor kinase A
MAEKIILIVDDDASLRNMISRLIRVEGEAETIFQASNGMKAVEIVRTRPIDLVIMDIVMPEMGGVEALKQIKRFDETIEVLMITGHARLESLRQILFDHGAFDYLLKPFDPVDLKLAVRRALRNREIILKSHLVKGELERRIGELEHELKERTFSQRKSQIKYRDIVESSRDGFAITQGDYIRFANATVMELTGYTPREIVDTPFVEFIHPDDRHAAAAIHQKRFRGEDVPDVVAFRVMRKDGAILWVEDHAAMTLWKEDPAVLHVIRDISERMKNEESLRIRDAALAASISGIALVDLDGHVTYANKSFAKMWGYGSECEVIGKPLRRLFHSHVKGAKAIDVLKTTGGFVDTVTAVREDGYSFPVQVSASMVRDESGRPICMMGSFLDITQQKRAEEMIMRTEKLSSLGQLSAGLAHELRNPLAVVNSCSQFCMEHMALEPRVRENFEVIHRNSQRACTLISELLAFARPDELTPNDVDINDVVATVLHMIRIEVDPGRVSFVKRLKKGLPLIRGDKEKLTQVFVNLVQNAIHAISDTGTIIVESRFLTSGNLVEINVVDTGPGIPEENRQRVFDPFFTTKQGGTGLGLSICHSIVEQHGGTIQAKQAEDGGARLCVRLPALKEGEVKDAG